jgi:hypothetical protein
MMVDSRLNRSVSSKYSQAAVEPGVASGCRRPPPRVVHQHVNPAEALQAEIERRLGRAGVGDVRLKCVHAPRSGREGRRRRARDHNDVVPQRVHALDIGLPDATRAPCDHDGLRPGALCD